jgi:hypothetical protein
MAEKTNPNTFSKGMVTDLDPAYQSKESYFTGLNVRVITNGDKSFSLENISGPVSVKNVNLGGTSSDLLTHGAVIVDDYLIEIKKQNTTTDPTWWIYKSTINLDGTLGSTVAVWYGAGLFDNSAGKIEIEAIVETETIHRIYCTDGITVLKTINLKDPNVGSKSASDFFAFKPNLMKPITLEDYDEFAGNLKYGSYVYVYRLGSSDQANFTDWSQVSMPVNVVKGILANENSLGIEGETSAYNSTTSLKLKIPNISQQFTIVQVAAVYYSSQNVQTVNIIEEGSIYGNNYEFTHSGFESEKVVEGGIADVIINNVNWDSCKSLCQKDNKLYAANLKSTIFDIDNQIAAFGKMKSYKAVKNIDDEYTLETHSGDANPHRHRNGSAGNWSWSRNSETDKLIYKFINKNFSTHQDPLEYPVYVLGAETNGYSSGSDGFRITFKHKDYAIDSQFNTHPDGTTAGANGDLEFAGDISDGLWQLGSSHNSSTFAGGKSGPHNPSWDNTYRSFKTGECYRFGIVFYDKQGTPGYVHHIGDIKMPDAMDPNSKVLSSDGTGCEDKVHHSHNSRWAPFAADHDDESKVRAYALIPRLDVRLPNSIINVISGYKVVRAELNENDKTIITQGILHNCERGQGNASGYTPNTTLMNKAHYPAQPFHPCRQDSSGGNAQPWIVRTPRHTGVLDTPDVTLGGKNYFFQTGYTLKNLYFLTAPRVHVASHNNYPTNYFGFKAQSNIDNGGQTGTGFLIYKFKPWKEMLASSTSDTVVSTIHQAYNGGNFFNIDKPINFAKTVVNGEIVTKSTHGGGTSSEDYIHRAPIFPSSQTDDGTGELHVKQYFNNHRASQTGDVNPAVFISLGDSDFVLPSRCVIGATTSSNSSDYVPMSNYLGGSALIENTYRSNPQSSDGYQWHLEGFKVVCEIVRNTCDSNGDSIFEQYGGHTESALRSTRFIPCRDFVPTGPAFNEYPKELTRGDVYLDWYSAKNVIKEGSTESSYRFGTVVPLESSINLGLRSGTYLGKEDVVSADTTDNFLYNTAYSQENNLIGNVVKPAGFVNNDIFKSKISASNTKILGELYDAWTVFPINDFIELNLAHGKITDLINYKNQLYAIQDRGVSLLSVNSRALIQGEGAAADIQIVTGTGTAIERYDYLTTEFGCQHFNTGLKTPTGFYFLDIEKGDILKCDGQTITPLALSNNYKSFIESLTPNASSYIPVSGSASASVIGLIDKGIFSGYDSRFREIYYTVIDQNETIHNFMISDLTGSLITKLELKDDIQGESLIFRNYINYNNELYGIALMSSTDQNSYNEIMYQFNMGVYQKFNVGFTINDNPAVNKVFDTAEVTFNESGAGDLVNGFSYHNFEDSIGTSSTSIYQKFREGNSLVALRGSGVRHRGNWLKYTLGFNQAVDGDNSYSTANNRKFHIFAVTSKIRQSR